ncbi:MAG: CBS domain-containing protein [Burkholderiaceae bacterium]
MRTVAQFLVGRSGPIWAVHPDNTVREALVLMAENNIGAVLVLVESRLAGVFSERDYARKVALQGRSSGSTPVREIMTSKVICVGPEQPIEDCMELMTHHHIRHLPVVKGDNLLGMISIGDVVREMMAEQKYLIEQLHHYIAG